ncbi:putative fucose kinase [Trypanosoma theileri]|uniref:Putative fucose kinase n=1 Tax=Trypanosoma theileri TaxID=67003 RepID=A0A1X0NG78_9TRYP|nr:putative fucose kinase [Trypanosoma theileri]ORC83601.1 putative fucose kinase [Trypanosoma theileri]
MPMRVLLSVPPSLPASHSSVERILTAQQHRVFFTSDPKGSRLGSGGGTTWLLEACYRSEQESSTVEIAAEKECDDKKFMNWLSKEPRIIVHSGGQSRRLPSYGPCGKVLAPIPVFRSSRGQRCDQTLLDVQMPLYEEVMRHAPSQLRTLITCGDVLILLDQPLPPIPEDTDVVCYGIQKEVDVLRKHGVFFMNRDTPDELETMLQKPTLKEIQEYAEGREAVMDIGLWLLSDRAIEVLRQRSTTESNLNKSNDTSHLKEYDLYSDFGMALGKHPLRDDALIQTLRVKIITLREARFFHYGTTEELITSTFAIQNTLRHSDGSIELAVSRHPATFTQNAIIHIPLTEEHRLMWIENSEISSGWTLEHHSVITGIPRNTWKLHVPAYVCIDVVPVRHDGKRGWVARPYGFNDMFRGPVCGESTYFLGQPLTEWMRQHHLPHQALFTEKTKEMDLQFTPLFPWCATVEELGLLIRWMICTDPTELQSTEMQRVKSLWETSFRFSANDLNDVADIEALLDARDAFQREILPIMASNSHKNPFYQMDLNHTALKYAAAHLPLPEKLSESDAPVMKRVHHHMFRARVLQYLLALWKKSSSSCSSVKDIVPGQEGEDKDAENEKEEVMLIQTLPPLLKGVSITAEILQRVYGITSEEELVARAEEEESISFKLLQYSILQDLTISTSRPSPKLAVMNDQIVWGRGPARIDLSGGWTDTPPYSIMCGGNVVNVGINLNGQPPLQVYIKPSSTPDITIRSIDLGVSETFTTYDELRRYDIVGSPYSIPKAALALAGFLPEFGSKSFTTLKEQLQSSFRGKGMEITLLVAIPAGSGLGTSSLVASTVLSALSDFCGLCWDAQEVGRRTLCVEQLLTTGGGWQDQYGGLFRGLKLLQSQPGFAQSPCVRWLPEHLLEDPRYAPCHLLYYTGITRTAKKILVEIVRGMFMNSASHLRVLSEMKQQALDLHDAITRGDFERYGKLIAKAWDQNKRLDAGTCSPPIADIISRIEKYVWGLKLAGAGGGGYLYMVAKDVEAARRIREELTLHPPNETARFVEMTVSHKGIQVSRS